MAQKTTLNKRSEDEDRISQLPDELIHRIFSFLTTNYSAVQASVLSKRWRRIWASLPYLNFDHTEFLYRSPAEYGRLESFTNFVSQFLLCRDPSPILKFRFYSYAVIQNSLLESLVCYAVKHHVQELYVNANLGEPIELPRSLFSCESLRVLELTGSYKKVKWPKSGDFWSLTTLCLGGFNEFDGKMLSSCPNLESLKLVNMYLGEHERFYIHALKLRALEILYFGFSPTALWECEVLIFAPSLANFKFCSHKLMLFSFENPTSLEEVDLDVYSQRNFRFQAAGFKHEFGIYTAKMLNELRYAKSITLSSSTIQVLSLVPKYLNEHPSSFPNLKYLKLKKDYEGCMVADVRPCVFIYFFKSSTLLKVTKDENSSMGDLPVSETCRKRKRVGNAEICIRNSVINFRSLFNFFLFWKRN